VAWAPVVGLVGDSLTFLGGLCLAREAILKGRESEGVKKIVKTLKNPHLAKFKVEMDGLRISDPESIETVFVHRNVKWAKAGAALLSIGFLLLLSLRISELVRPSESTCSPGCALHK